jgi:uncharacterized surface protein with fasciclin (FAS1) repeats
MGASYLKAGRGQSGGLPSPCGILSEVRRAKGRGFPNHPLVHAAVTGWMKLRPRSLRISMQWRGPSASRRRFAGKLDGNFCRKYTEFPMSKRLSLIAAAAVLALTAGTAVTYSAAMAENTVSVGGAPMYPSKNIIQNAVNSKDHTTLVAAVKAAGLVDTLQGAGPFTVFAPTNEAFAKLPAGTVDTLLKPENKATLTKVLTYHVVPGRMTAGNLMKAVKDGEGEAKLKTVSGDWLIVKQAGPGKLTVTDAKGDVAMVTIADVLQSNGVIHVVDTVLLP